jgi:hypothetical protein
MPNFDDYVIFADESGDHAMASINPEYPIFVLAVCLFERRVYESKIVPWVDRLKDKHFGTTEIILHERDIRKGTGDFVVLTDPAVRASFLADVNTLIRRAPFTLIASIIRKDKLAARYIRPENPYHLSAGFCLERLTMHLKTRRCRMGRAEVIFERRGLTEDRELELEFRRVCDGDNQLRKRLPFDARFEPKSRNLAGLQFADLIARPIGRNVLKPKQPNRAYDVLYPKFRTDWLGRVEGRGRKIFP